MYELGSPNLIFFSGLSLKMEKFYEEADSKFFKAGQFSGLEIKITFLKVQIYLIVLKYHFVGIDLSVL